MRTGSLGTVVALEVTDRDEEKLRHNTDAELTFDDLPVIILIQVQGGMTKRFPGLPVGELCLGPLNGIYTAAQTLK